MTDDEDALARAYGDALIRELRAEMGRRNVTSVRALARAVGMNHATLSERFSKSSRSGKRTPMTQEELWRICSALGVEPYDIVQRAAASAREVQVDESGRDASSDAG